MNDTQDSRDDSMTQKDLLEVWGYLQALKDIFEGKARDATQRGDTIGDKLAGDYLREAVRITALQGKIDREAAALE